MENQVKAGTMPKHTPQFLRQRKFFLVLPLLILPFSTMAFWALGGGKTGIKTKAASREKGIDLAMPSAQFKNDRAKDKMEIYQAAAKDSAAAESGVSRHFVEAMGFSESIAFRGDSAAIRKIVSPSPLSADQQSAKIEARLAQINHQINRPQREPEEVPYSEQHADAYRNANKIKKMISRMGSDKNPDPELQQLSKMMEQLQAIQNPPTVKPQPERQAADTLPFRAFPAIIDGRQKVADGGEVRLKLTDSVTLKTILLPKGQVLYGPCQVTNQRLLLSIKNIRQGVHIIPVDLTVFGLDGLQGIPAHEAELAGTTTGGANNTLSGMQFLNMDQSIGAQAAAGGIQTAKDIFSKKVRKMKVKLENNFPVLLRDNQQRTR